MNDGSRKYREVFERQAVEARDGNRFRWYFGTPITFEGAYHCTRLVVDVEEPTIDQWREAIDKDMSGAARTPEVPCG